MVNIIFLPSFTGPLPPASHARRSCSSGEQASQQIKSHNMDPPQGRGGDTTWNTSPRFSRTLTGQEEGNGIPNEGSGMAQDTNTWEMWCRVITHGWVWPHRRSRRGGAGMGQQVDQALQDEPHYPTGTVWWVRPKLFKECCGIFHPSLAQDPWFLQWREAEQTQRIQSLFSLRSKSKHLKICKVTAVLET